MTHMPVIVARAARLVLPLLGLALVGGACSSSENPEPIETPQFVEHGEDAKAPPSSSTDANFGSSDATFGSTDVSHGPPEICGNGLDENHNGIPDDGCPCTGGATQKCYIGDAANAGIGICKYGTQTCVAGSGELKQAAWGPCTGYGAPLDGGKCVLDPDQYPCEGNGLVWAKLDDPCIDDGGGNGADDILEIYCQNGIARFCLSHEACPWRGGGTTSDDITCSRAGLGSDYLASVHPGCQGWEGHDLYCCSPSAKISFSGCQ